MSVPTEAEHAARLRSVTVTLDRSSPAEPASPQAHAAWVLARASKHVLDSHAAIGKRVLPRFYDEVKRLRLHDSSLTTLQEDSAIALLLAQLVGDVLHEAARSLDTRLAVDLAADILTHTNKGDQP